MLTIAGGIILAVIGIWLLLLMLGNIEQVIGAAVWIVGAALLIGAVFAAAYAFPAVAGVLFFGTLAYAVFGQPIVTVVKAMRSGSTFWQALNAKQ